MIFITTEKFRVLKLIYIKTKKQYQYYSLLIFILIFSLIFVYIISKPTSKVFTRESIIYQNREIIQPDFRKLLNDLDDHEKVSVIITLKEQADLSQFSPSGNSTHSQNVIEALQSTTKNSQREILPLLNFYKRSSVVEDIVQFWIFNGFSIKTTPLIIEELADHPDILSIRPDQIELIPSSIELETIFQDNLSLINTPLLWDQGWMGQGVVIASMDTGVDLYHPDLNEKWRGGLNSWYDPFGKHDIPTDLNGHGTMTMGVILGGDLSGTSIGVAPKAQWIAVKIFDDDGLSSATAVHLGFQWLLDPDNDPQTDDAPQIVNNSWSFSSPGCNTEFLLDVKALHAAGILPVFSGGNFGPNDYTNVSPANYPESFAVGAVTNEDLILSLSSRGPSMCTENETIYPEVTAPGYNIFSSDLHGFYNTATGTSLAAPHVTGSIALLLSAFPSLSLEDQESALIDNAIDLGEPGPDNVFGYGRIDVNNSYQAIFESGNFPTATPMPTPTATLIPSPTPTSILLPITDSFQYYLPIIIGN